MRQLSSLAVALTFLCLLNFSAFAQEPTPTDPHQAPEQGATPQVAPQAPQAAPNPAPVRHSVTSGQNEIGFVLTSLPAKLQNCSPVASSGYAGSACKVELDRDLAISPPALSLPGGTTIYIVLKNPHGDENIAFNSATTFTVPEDLLADALKSLVTPGSAFVARGVMQPFDLIMGDNAPVETDTDPIPALQKKVVSDLKKVLNDVQDANTTVACLETYKPVAGTKGKLYCDQTGYLTPNAYTITTPDSVISKAIAKATEAAKKVLPVGELAHIDGLLKTSACLTKEPNDPCYAALDKDQFFENLYNSQVSSLQIAQNGLLTAVQMLKTLAPMPDQLVFMAKLTKNHNATITVTGTEIATKTVTTIGAVTLNTQATRFILSTGLLYGSTAYRNYSITSQFNSGVVSGTTQITKTLNIPAIDFPFVMGSYMSRRLNNHSWENRCPNHCAFLFSVGIGANLVAKTADIAGGPSFQIGGFLITPVAIGARQNHLLNNLYVGQTNSGITQTSGITSANHWVPGAGIALTYTIPTP